MYYYYYFKLLSFLLIIITLVYYHSWNCLALEWPLVIQCCTVFTLTITVFTGQIRLFISWLLCGFYFDVHDTVCSRCSWVWLAYYTWSGERNGSCITVTFPLKQAGFSLVGGGGSGLQWQATWHPVIWVISLRFVVFTYVTKHRSEYSWG